MSKQKKVPCGKVEMLVLEYLAENRSSLIQPMQLAIGKHYKVVYEAVTRLETNGLIEVGELKKSNDSYELSVKGIGFVWAYSDNFNVIKQSLKNYNDVIGSHNNQDYLTLEKNLPRNIMIKIFRITGFSVLEHGISAFDMHKAISTAIIHQTSASPARFSNSEMRQVKRVALTIQEARNGIRQIGQELLDLANSPPEEYDDSPIRELVEKQKEGNKHE